MLLTLAFLSDHFVFGKRCDKNPLLKYYTSEDLGLSAEAVSLPNGLNGFIYNKNGANAKESIIIFCHGMGPGHIAYTTEIEYFCNVGYTVLAIDSRGCGFSQGKNMKGMYSGVKTVISAIDFAKENHFKNIYLVGHSWGAYSALCASAKRKVDKVVAISAPNTPSRTMRDGAVNMGVLPRLVAAILQPFWAFVNFVKFGAKGNANAAKCACKNSTPTLLIHGDKDGVVQLKNSAFSKADGKYIEKFLAEGKGHNPYNTVKAETYLAQLSQYLKKKQDVSNFDFSAATEEDVVVMQKIFNFLES